MFECVDLNMEPVPGSLGHTSGGHLEHVEAASHALLITTTKNSTVLSAASERN